MDFWHWGGFFKSVKGHVIKWWQQVILPVFHLNNNEAGNSLNQQEIKRKTDDGAKETAREKTYIEGKAYIEEKADRKGTVKEENNQDSGSTQDAQEILKRLEREKQEEEEKARKKIEEMRKKNQEQERIAAIMNANQVNVNAFIEEGKAIRENTLEEEADAKQQEDMRRAQEIIDRLNREAAEDDAKKKAEIEAARKRAEAVEKQEV